MLRERLRSEVFQIDRLPDLEVTNRRAFEGRHYRARAERIPEIAAKRANICAASAFDFERKFWVAVLSQL